MNFILNRSMSRKDSLKSTSIMSCDSSSSSSSSSSGCCSNLSSSTAQVSGGEEVCVSSSNISNSGERKKSISSPCHSKGGVGSSVTCISSHSSCFPDHRFPDHRFSGSDFNSDRHCNLSQRSPSTVPSSTNGSISSSLGVQSDVEFGPMGTIKRKSSSSPSSASTHLNGPVLPLTSITRSLAKHSSDDCLLVEINEDRVIRVNSGTSGDNYNCNGNILLQSNIQYGTLKMRRSFRNREVSSSFRDSNYSYSNRGSNNRFITRRSSQATNTSSECSSILSQPVHEQEEEEMIRRMRRDSSSFDPEEDASHDDLPLPPPPECGTGLTTSLSTLSLISLPPPPPEFSCATLDTNTLSSASSSSPSSSPSTATHSLDRSCCNSGSNVSTRDNTLTRTNVRLHQEQHSNQRQEQQSNQRQERVVGSGHHCCQHRSSLSPSSASSSSYEDISCDGQECSKCPPMGKQQNRQMAKSGAVGNRYQCYDERMNGHEVPCCSKSVVSNGRVNGRVNGGRAVPMRSVSCCTRELGAKQKILRSGSRVDSSFASSSASHHHQHSSHLNHHPNESINPREGRRQCKGTYSSTSSSSCSSRDGEDLSVCSSMRECQSPEGRIQRLESFETVDDSLPQDSVQQHKTHAQARMKAKICGLNRSDQPIYDSVFTYRKQQPQPSQNIASDSTNVSSYGLSHESNHRLSEPQKPTSRQVSRGSKDYDELPLPPPPLELSSNQQFQEVPNHQIQQLPNHQIQQVPNHQIQQVPVHGNNEISYMNGSSIQPVYGVVNKGKRRKEEERKGDPDPSLHHPVPVRSPVKGPLPPPPEEFVKNLHRVMEKKWKVAQALTGSDISQNGIPTTSFLAQALTGSDFSQNGIPTTSFHPDSSLAVGEDQFASSEQVRMGFNHDSSLLPHPPPPDHSHIMPTSQVSNQTSHQDPLPPPPSHHHHHHHQPHGHAAHLQPHGHAAHHNSMIDPPSSVPPPPPLTFLPFQYQQQKYHLYQQSQQQSYPPSSGNEDGGFYDVLPITVRPFDGIPIHQGGNPVSGNSGHSFQHQLGGSQSGVNHHRHHAENGSSSGSVFSRMIPFRRSSKVSSISSPNSSVSNYSSSSSAGGGGGGGVNGSKGAPPPPPKRSDKTKLSQRK